MTAIVVSTVERAIISGWTDLVLFIGGRDETSGFAPGFENRIGEVRGVNGRDFGVCGIDGGIDGGVCASFTSEKGGMLGNVVSAPPSTRASELDALFNLDGSTPAALRGCPIANVSGVMF